MGPGDGRGLRLAWLLYALLAAALLAVEMPPYQNPDEANHLMRAEQLSRFGLVGERFQQGRDSGGAVAPGIEATAALFEGLKFHPERRVTASMLQAAGQVGWAGAPVPTGFANTSIYPPLFYTPSVLAIWAGKLAGLPVTRTLALARLLTALASAALVMLALSVCLRAGLVGPAFWLFALATLPMAFALQSACSQDGPLLGVAALAAALLARLRLRPERGGFGLLCLCLGLIVMARPPYLPLALLPLATTAPRRTRLLGAAAVAGAGLAWTAIAAVFAAIDTTAQHGADVAAQLRLLLNPVWALRVAFGTLRTYGGFYLDSFVGRLGWLDATLPTAFIAAAWAALALLAASLLARRPRPPAGAMLIGAGLLLCAGAVFLVQYLTWTAVGYPVIEGVQGRYFLPLALLLGALLTGTPPALLARAWLLFPALALGVTMRALVVRYYLGG